MKNKTKAVKYKDYNMTLKEIAKQEELTPQRVQQIIELAIKKLNKKMRADGSF